MSVVIDPEFEPFLSLFPRLDLSDIAQARAELAAMVEAAGVPDTIGVSVREVNVAADEQLPSVRVRIYEPESRISAGCILHCHGGGFVVGDLELDHARCAELAREVGAMVVAVDYRLAPEHPYPAALDDCRAALTWVTRNTVELGIEATHIVLHGTSAGGGLCAALALLSRDGLAPAACFQFLSVPVLDDRLQTTSAERFVETPIWNRPNAIVSWDSYLGAGSRGGADVSAYAAPARAVDLSGLPPAFIALMQNDPLRDEGIEYAQRLLATGVSVELHLFPKTFHGSVLMADAEVSRRELAEEVAVLTRVFAYGPTNV
jgi:acetyl esterase/lipase